MQNIRQQLHLKIKEFILRREKGKLSLSAMRNRRKVRKHDVVAWIPMSIKQQDMYREVLKSNRVQTILKLWKMRIKLMVGTFCSP